MSEPYIILVRPQLGENIGKAARAMLNFGLTRMRLVAPRDGWPNPSAGPAAAGADRVLDQAETFESLEAAIADCTQVIASTVRPRDMPKAVVRADEAAALCRAALRQGGQPAVLFGAERSGLHNDEVALADTILTVPVNPDFGSLNVAQAVILMAYEWFRSDDATLPAKPYSDDRPASKAMLQGLYDQVESALDARGYFRSEDRREVQIRSLRTLWQNCAMTEQEVRTLRGVIKTLTWAPKAEPEER